MIVPELIMTDIVSKMQPITVGENELMPSFHYGNKDELNRYLDLFKDKVYPLIWMLPSKESHNVREVSQKVDLILAVNFNLSDKDRLNNERITSSFERILIPLSMSLFDAINRNHNANYDNSDYEVFKYPNYRETRENSGKTPKTIAYWDAMTLSLNMGFFNKCKI